MITFPNAKINLGLNITEKRADGYHNLETIFYPVQIEDALEICDLEEKNLAYKLHISGVEIEGKDEDNLVVKAYELLKREYELPPVEIYLHKHIPSGAGLGGGSSDAAFMLKLLNEKFNLQLAATILETYAASLGADCAFFIKNKPVFATGIGNLFESIELNMGKLYIVIVKPNIFVSTRDAFSLIKPAIPVVSIKNIITRPVEDWKELLINDFEKSVFHTHPEIKAIKDKLYNEGAVYASMSGSGSSVFGLFHQAPSINTDNFPACFVWSGRL